MKILADENVKAKLVKFLNGTGINTEYAPKSLKNSKLFNYACEQKRILLTHDKDFMKTEIYEPKLSSGIVLLRIHPPKLSVLKDIVNQLSSSVGLLDSGATKQPKDFVGLLYFGQIVLAIFRI